MKETTHYKLKKIELTDSPPDITVHSENFDIIDTKLKEAIDKAESAFQSASDGKVLVAGAITGKGVPTAPSDTFSKMATNINAIETDPSIGTTDAVASDIIKGKKAVSQGNLLTGSLELTANALAAQVLAGVTFYNTNPKQKLTGTMPNRAGNNNALATTRSGNILRLRAPQGFYDGVDDTVQVTDANWVATNIRDGTNIFGLAGNLVENNINTIQQGVIDFGTGSTINIPINTVNVNRSIVIIDTLSPRKQGLSAGESAILGELTSSSNLKLSRFSSYEVNPKVSWKVIEFKGNIQKGQYEGSGSVRAHQINITPVNISKSIVVASYKLSNGGGSPMYIGVLAHFNNTSSIILEVDIFANFDTKFLFQWYVVELY